MHDTAMPAPQPDRTVADAIDRVLEAERTAAAVIVAAEDQARATIDAAVVCTSARRRVSPIGSRTSMSSWARA
jgi:regulator of protease activity HflC (stomatin/prohibitin superfamily)